MARAWRPRPSRSSAKRPPYPLSLESKWRHPAASYAHSIVAVQEGNSLRDASLGVQDEGPRPVRDSGTPLQIVHVGGTAAGVKQSLRGGKAPACGHSDGHPGRHDCGVPLEHRLSILPIGKYG